MRCAPRCGRSTSTSPRQSWPASARTSTPTKSAPRPLGVRPAPVTATSSRTARCGRSSPPSPRRHRPRYRSTAAAATVATPRTANRSGGRAGTVVQPVALGVGRTRRGGAGSARRCRRRGDPRPAPPRAARGPGAHARRVPGLARGPRLLPARLPSCAVGPPRRRTSRRSVSGSCVRCGRFRSRPTVGACWRSPRRRDVVASIAVDGALEAPPVVATWDPRTRDYPGRGMVNDEDDAEPTRDPQVPPTAIGTVLAAGLLGVADALEGPRDEEVAIVHGVLRRAAVLRSDRPAARSRRARGLDRARPAPARIELGPGAQRLARDRARARSRRCAPSHRCPGRWARAVVRRSAPTAR